MPAKKQKFLTVRDLAQFTEDVLLPGVERIVKEEGKEIKKELSTLVTEKIDDVKKSIRVLGGDIIELKAQRDEERHEVRIKHLERITSRR